MIQGYTRRQFLFSALAAAGTAPALWLLNGCRGAGAKLGQLPVEVIRKGSSPFLYLVIHGNETTAKEVLREHMRTHAGTAYIVRNDQRTIRVRELELDPNRMFSREGAEKNLRSLNPNATEAQLQRVLDELDRERAGLLSALQPPRGGVLIALHNNRETYSVQTEIPISDAVSLVEPSRPRDFYLTTDPQDFEILRRSPYNAVLQSKAPPDDDGSLSRYCAKQGIRYVNNEVAIGEFERQREMVLWLAQNLRR
jgi:hypothetical protein